MRGVFMYNQADDVKLLKEKKSLKETSTDVNIKKLIISLIVLVLIIFAIVYIVTYFQKGNNEKHFESNFILLKNSAYNFFSENERPQNINETKSVNLRILKELGYINDIIDNKGNSCNEGLSTVVITKNTDTKYSVKTTLTCDGTTKNENYVYTFPTNGTIAGSTLYLLKKDIITNNAVYSCPSGYYLEGETCYLEISTITTSASPTYKTIKASNTKASYKKATTTYEYTTPYNSTTASTYKCPSGTTDVNGQCFKYSSSKTETVCPSGYTKSGSTCYKYVDAEYYVKSWKFVETIKTYDETLTEYESKYEKLTLYSKGKNSNGQTVYYYRRYTSNLGYICPQGKLKNTDQCYITTNTSTLTTCSSGYNLNAANNQCYKQYDSIEVTGKTSYSCPAGYSTVGSGSSTKCRKAITSEGYYYCSKSDAILQGDRCIISGSTYISKYTCPSSYKLNGTTCYKYTKASSTKATRTIEQEVTTEYYWHKNKDLAGWAYTGESKQA